jgi:uncharacterized protein involved in exopolysaccharide biosynthesis
MQTIDQQIREVERQLAANRRDAALAEIDFLRNQRGELLLKYSEKHPAIVALDRRIDEVREAAQK